MKRPVELLLLRGLPASGKSTFAHGWVRADPARRARVGRDDLRIMLHNSYDHESFAERAVTIAQQGLVGALLDKGTSVVVDDTNLRSRTVRDWMDLAVAHGATFAVRDFPVPTGEAIARDRRRAESGERTVGPSVIESMAKRYLQNGLLPPLPEPREPVPPYLAPADAPEVVLCDVDGTVALMNGRGPYDWAAVGADTPNQPVIDALRRLAVDCPVIFLSGRDGVCHDATLAWLTEHVWMRPVDRLVMREPGDNRRDSVVKAELFDTHVRDRFAVRAVLDDRDQVVELWRSLGLLCLQVGPGKF